MSKDYYKILGLSRHATSDEIKKQYRTLAMQYHPDRCSGDKSAEEKFKEINEAYSVLGDPQKKQMYDQFGEVPSGNYNDFSSGSFSGFGSIFEDIDSIFSSFFNAEFGRNTNKKRNFDNKGEDLQFNIKLDFLSSVLGKDTEIEIDHMIACEQCGGRGTLKNENKKNCIVCGGSGYERVMHRSIFANISTQQICSRCRGIGVILEDPCKVCKGDGRVNKKEKINFKIPAGIDDRQYIILKGKGNAGIMGGKSGDLYVVFSIDKSPIFERDGLNIISKVQINVLYAILGGKVNIDTIHGKYELIIPPGTQYSDQISIKNMGIHTDDGKKGSHIAIIDIIIPKKINKKETELYNELLNIYLSS